MTTEEKYNESKKWFIDRIGKTIYRDATSCGCKSCECVTAHGIKVVDEMHAEYLNDYSLESGVKYREEK